MTTFTLSPALKELLPNYGDLDFELPTLNSELFRGNEDADTVRETYTKLRDESLILFDWTILSVCGWSVKTLLTEAQHCDTDWVELMFSEIASDEEDPFKETGNVLLRWAEATDTARAEADAVYKGICGSTMTDVLLKICAEIEEQLVITARYTVADTDWEFTAFNTDKTWNSYHRPLFNIEHVKSFFEILNADPDIKAVIENDTTVTLYMHSSDSTDRIRSIDGLFEFTNWCFHKL
jgi:hypothetical protein